MDKLSTMLSIRENADTVRSLEQHVRSPSGIIPFVGAGMSSCFGYPLWIPFLIEQAGLADTHSETAEMLQSGKYEEAAEKLMNDRGAARFNDAISNKFGERPLTPAAIHRLPLLSTGTVLTTNFDEVLERVFQSAGQPFERIILGRRVDDAWDAHSRGRQLLLKLHGDRKFTQDRVLTLSEYTAAYGSADPLDVDSSRPLPKLLRLVLQSRPLLFLGCSLTLDRTMQVLRAVVSANDNVRHYALVSLPADQNAFKERDRFLSDLGIRPIWYPSGQHEHIELLLDCLVDGRTKSALQPHIGGSGICEAAAISDREASLPVTKDNLSPVVVGPIRLRKTSPDPVQNWIPRLNRFLGGETEVCRMVESEPTLVDVGSVELSAVQRVQVAKCRSQLKINDQVAILVDALLEDPQVILHVKNTEYAVVQVLDRLGQRPTMISATSLIVCMENEELILHRRSAASRDFAGALHVFGGSFSPFYDHNSLIDTGIRETLEESRIPFTRSMISDMVLIHEKANGFMELALLGIGVGTEAVEIAGNNPEGAPVKVKFCDLAATLVDSESGGPLTKVPLFAWLALGARVSGKLTVEAQFGGHSGQELFESIVP